jgi:hypothetical protein
VTWHKEICFAIYSDFYQITPKGDQELTNYELSVVSDVDCVSLWHSRTFQFSIENAMTHQACVCKATRTCHVKSWRSFFRACVGNHLAWPRNGQLVEIINDKIILLQGALKTTQLTFIIIEIVLTALFFFGISISWGKSQQAACDWWNQQSNVSWIASHLSPVSLWRESDQSRRNIRWRTWVCLSGRTQIVRFKRDVLLHCDWLSETTDNGLSGT